MSLPWKCESCKHEWKDSSFVTYIDCPECGSEEAYHGSLIEDDDEEEVSK
jgi:predicted RNA-binding Zn-ribbon protein involved in translation (DUF1610 family)